MMDGMYRSRYTGELIEGFWVGVTRFSFTSSYGDMEVAEPGDFVIQHPYEDRLDRESFEREYEYVGEHDE